ncbi:MAG: DUF951 domain-containing protein [Dehalococcoidales bacterium]
MTAEIKVGAIVQLRKKHPCGNDRWQVVRIGADIGIICLGCKHKVMLERGTFEKRVKAVIAKDTP